MAETSNSGEPYRLISMESPFNDNESLLTPQNLPPVPETSNSESMPANPAPTASSSQSRKLSTFLLVTLSSVVVVIWNSFLTFKTYGISSESVGFWIGSLILPFLIAYLAGGMRKWRNPIVFSVCLLLLGVAVPAATHQKTLSSLPKKQMLREVAGTDPLDPNLTANDASAASAIRQVFAELRQFRQDYNSKFAALKPALDAVCTTRSFATLRDMQRTRDAVAARLDLDRNVSDFLQKFPALVANKFDQTNLRSTQKEQYEDGFKVGFANSEYLSARNDTMQSEESWAAATLDLYDFAMQHPQQISIGGGKVRISGHALFLAFNLKLHLSESLHRDFAAKNARLIAIQQASFKKAGVTSNDLGIAQ